MCLALLPLAACASGTPRDFRDPAFPDQPTYQAFVREHLVLTEGKILSHFPGLLDCKVEAATEGYSPEEVKVLDAYAQVRNYATMTAAADVEKARAARRPAGYFLSKHPECADIRAQPGAFVDGHDYVTKAFLNHIEPLFDKHDVSEDLRNETADCYWRVVQSRLSPSEVQDLDSYAQGGPHLHVAPKQDEVNVEQMAQICPATMGKLKGAFTEYILVREYQWPGRS
jgi:hypothetical protein